LSPRQETIGHHEGSLSLRQQRELRSHVLVSQSDLLLARSDLLCGCGEPRVLRDTKTG